MKNSREPKNKLKKAWTYIFKPLHYSLDGSFHLGSGIDIKFVFDDEEFCVNYNSKDGLIVRDYDLEAEEAAVALSRELDTKHLMLLALKKEMKSKPGYLHLRDLCGSEGQESGFLKLCSNVVFSPRVALEEQVNALKGASSAMLLDYMSQSSDEDVRYLVASNSYTSLKTLQKLAHDPVDSVRQMVLDICLVNSCVEGVEKILVNDPSEYIRSFLASYSQSKEIIDILRKDGQTIVSQRAAQNYSGRFIEGFLDRFVH